MNCTTQKKITIEVSAHDDSVLRERGEENLFLFGYPVARAFGRDSGAKTADGVAVISGGFCSAGSRKNWYCDVKENTIFRMQVPKMVYEKYITEYMEKDINIEVLSVEDE